MPKSDAHLRVHVIRFGDIVGHPFGYGFGDSTKLRYQNLCILMRPVHHPPDTIPCNFVLSAWDGRREVCDSNVETFADTDLSQRPGMDVESFGDNDLSQQPGMDVETLLTRPSATLPIIIRV